MKILCLILLVAGTFSQPGFAFQENETKSKVADSQQEKSAKNDSLTDGSNDNNSQQSADAPDPEFRRFNEADLDADGSISVAEMKAYLDDKLPGFKNYRRLIETVDSDGNTKITREEFVRRREIAKQLENEPVEFTDQLNNRFDNQDPKIGTKIEGLVAFDENGNAINFNSFRGKYTVITFGCLT